MIEPIQQIGAISPAKQTVPVSRTELGGGSLFESIFQSAIQNVKDTDADWVQSEYLMSTGQLDNPATALISFSKLSTATNLLIQLRNKALDAYSELTRLSM